MRLSPKSQKSLGLRHQRPETLKAESAQRLLATLLTFLLGFWCPLTFALAADDAAYRFGTLQEYSTYSSGEMLSDGFVFSDAWFLEAPEERNDALALASMQLTAAAVEEGSDKSGGAFLQDLGFEQIGFERFDSADPNDCTYTWGTKTITDGSDSYTLVAVAIQSSSLSSQTKIKGWKQNFTLNGDSEEATTGEHFAFARAADTVVDEIAALGGTGKVKYWIVGQSRGGALANLIAARLSTLLGASNAGIYAYTFEAPAMVDADTIADPSAYAYIHNYRCSDDIVTKIPLWGMTVYGVTHELKTDETDAALVSELTKLGSGASELEIPDSEVQETSILQALEDQVPTRADYSRARTDTFADAEGSQITATYSYQDVLVSLMGMIFGGELEGLSPDDAISKLGEAAPALVALGNVVSQVEAGELPAEEALPYYWEAAKALRSLLVQLSATGNVSMNETEFYALLRLIAPFAYDTGYECTGDDLADTISYLTPLLSIAADASSFIYSHHFDMIIARLKTLAPQVPMDNVDIVIEEPAAGDSAGKAPADVADFVTSLGSSWLTVEAAWQGSDDPLENDSVKYLDVTLRAVGHVAPEGFQATINGVAPIGDLDVTYEGGVCIIRGTWEYIIGSPESVTITFDAAGHGEAPASMTVDKGTSLKYVDAPDFVKTVTEDGATWRFGGWVDEAGTAWDDLMVAQDMTVYAKWIRVIDDVRLYFPTPKVGDKPAGPTVPEGAPYYISSFTLMDSTWNGIESIDAPGSYVFECDVSVVDPDSGEFALEEVEGYFEYLGSITLNDGAQSIESNYDESGPYIRVECHFEVTEEAPEAATYAFTEGAGQTWTKGSGLPAEFVVKRSVDDGESFGRFTGLEVDGKSLDASSYGAKEGSVIISLKSAYLETLSEGTHTLTAQFDDGTAEASFTVQASKQDEESDPKPDTKPDSKPDKNKTPLPKTGDEDFGPWIIALASLGATALFGGMKMRRRASGR